MARLTRALLQLALIALSFGAALPRQQQQEQYDAIIVGGGPSGLSALSGLARVRRKVLLIDSGEYRNAKTRHLHDLIGLDGVTPAYYRWAAREQLSHYETVSWTNGTVTAITPSPPSTPDAPPSFAITTANTTYHARKLVLATGLRDLLPPTPGIAENWAQGIFWCPWCDGHEHADQPLGLLGPLSTVASSVQEIHSLNTDIVAFVNGTDTPDARAAATAAYPDWLAYLALRNVTLDNRTLAGVVRLADGGAAYNDSSDPALPTVPEYDAFRVDFETGPSVQRAAFLASFPKAQLSGLGRQLGITLYGDRLYANQSGGLQTNVPGVYAVGDANTDNSTNIPHALWSGKRAAVSLHVKLESEDGQRELAEGDNVAKRATELSARDVWEVMNGEPGDVLYAGEFER